MIISNFTTVDKFILIGLTNKQDIKIMLFIIFLLCYIVSLFGNIVIIWISSINPRLNTPMYFFLRNLSLLDIWYTSSVVPKMLINFLSVKKTISFDACFIQLFIHLSLGGAECYLLLMMAYDRYVAICSPLHYTNIMHPVLCIKMATASWFGGIANSIVQTFNTLHLPFCGPNEINHFFCEAPILLELACADTSFNKMIIFLCAIVVAVIPFFFILITYVNIISSIMKIRTTTGRRKAFSTCASHVTVVTLFYGTIFIIYLRPGSVHVSNQDKMATLFYSVITPILNPLIYTLRNKDVKSALREITRTKILNQNM
ncbi:olfactory receptor 2G3-like [Hyla sarda]|uniref:olfactory receptor 2G3-like n=1 Tax=Hyla sarda TaxID=327740 RepID=UPI0024C3B6A0|nr:olfactory receptor 2G3-like [Hyla sarda]